MAKKDPTDLSVEEKLKTLYQLQSALSAIDEKRALRASSRRLFRRRRARLLTQRPAWLVTRLSLMMLRTIVSTTP